MRDVQLLLLDVDGVLTDGRLTMLPGGIESKTFHVQDGLGICRAIEQGVHVGIISGRKSAAVTRRANELGIQTVVQGCDDKAPVVLGIARYLGTDLEQVAYIGDDLNDLEAMRLVGIPVAVSNAAAAVQKVAVLTTERRGGSGAVREAIDWLLDEPTAPSFSVAIPARLQSTRLPRKVLADIGGRPMLEHVYKAAAGTRNALDVAILTDSAEVQAAAESWGAKVILTPADCASGTERIASVIDQLRGDLIVNIQADQPFLTSQIIDDLVYRSISFWENGDVFTPVFELKTTEELLDEGIVKVVRDGKGKATYFSRASVPFYRDQPVDRWIEHTTYWGHQGIYLFRREVLERFFDLDPSTLESVEKLEQLRFMENGLTIQTLEMDAPSLSIDLPEHLETARYQMANEDGLNGGATYA